MARNICFILEANNHGGKADSEGHLPHPANNQWAKVFIGGGRGLRAETAPSALIVILKLTMRWSDQHHLVSRTVCLLFQGRFVPISLRPLLRIVAAYVLATVWSLLLNFVHLMGVSGPARQLPGHGSEYYLQPLRRN